MDLMVRVGSGLGARKFILVSERVGFRLAKSSYPDEFCQILRQSNFHNFCEVGCLVDFKNGIFEKNLESRK